MNKKYYWFKLKEDFFQDKIIKKLRKIPNGEIYIIIYLKMLLLGLKDEGNLYFEGIEETFIEEISLEIDEQITMIEEAINFFKKVNWLEEKNQDHYFLTKMQNMVGKETASADRMRKHRKKQKESVSQSDTEINKEIDIETELKLDCFNKTNFDENSFTFTNDHQQLASKYYLDIHDEFVKFKDHHLSKGNNFKDWEKAFNNWLRNAYKFKPQTTNVIINAFDETSKSKNWVNKLDEEIPQ